MIQILRLKNGEDIIGEIYTDTGDIEIVDPMTVGIEYRNNEPGLVMRHWLPVQLIHSNRTVIKKEDVLTFFHPNKEFSEYYENTVKKMNELLQAKKFADELTNEEIEDIMDAFEDLDNNEHTLH